MCDQKISNLIVCLMISQKLHIKNAQLASKLQWILRKFDFSQNEFEMRRAKKAINQPQLAHSKK